MFESEDGNFSIRRCMECFDMHLPADLKTEKPIIHISLNPHPDDVLSDSQLADIAKEYMDKLGYGNQPYMVYILQGIIYISFPSEWMKRAKR